MDADAGLGAEEVHPSEDNHAEVGRCVAHRIEPPVKFEFPDDSPLLCKRHHVESELLKYPRVVEHVCSRKSAPKNSGRTKSQLIASFWHGLL